ncbi:hypothetical protein EDD85DRAFT_155361 [Armillaria nabsnona]|nr:hypothetical protein EDD85DRAFT_155361 [Armillaria nabsnona]
MCSLVSKQWSAIIKEVNSTHLVIPLSYSGGYLYTIHSMSSIPQPLLCRTITFKVDYYIMKLYHVQNPGCRPSITTNRGIESVLQRLFYGPNTPPDGIHIYVHYLGDAQVHIPRFWLPLQATLLTIVYHYRWWVPVEFPRRIQCQCVQPTLARRVRQLCILGCADSWVMPLITPLTEWKCLTSLTTNVQLDIPVPSFTVTTYDYPAEDMGTEYISRVMFDEREFSGTSLIRGSGLDSCFPYHNRYISMFEQVIPLGSVGYIHPFSKKFVVLFNAFDPASSGEARINCIPSLLKEGQTKMIANPKYSPFPAWDYEYKKSDILRKLGAWTMGRSVYSIPVALNIAGILYLGLGRAISRELVGDQAEIWLSEHQQTIMDVFGADHPYIRDYHGLGIVTTTVDSSQYVWFILLERTSGSFTNHFYFQVDPHASNNPGQPWGKMKHRKPMYSSWDHISTVGQSPMTLQIRCRFVCEPE